MLDSIYRFMNKVFVIYFLVILSIMISISIIYYNYMFFIVLDVKFNYSLVVTTSWLLEDTDCLKQI